MWVPNHRPPLSCVLPHKLSSCIRILKSTSLAYYFHSFWSRHFSFSRLNAEPQRSCFCCSQLILSSRGLYPVSWAIRKKWASHRKSPFTLTWNATPSFPGKQAWAASRTLPPLSFPLQQTWANVASKELCYFPPLNGVWGTQNVTKKGMITRWYLALSSNGKVGTHI